MRAVLVAFALLGAIFNTKVGHALPLLSESAGKLQYGTLTLYKDHQDPNKVYYFPNSTRFSTDNSNIPLFNFVSWGFKDPNSTDKGGYFSMVTRLESDPLQKTALQAFAKEHPRASIAVIPVKSSTIGLTTTKKSEAPLGLLFQEFNFSKVGGRAEDEIGINAVLTPTGARAFRAALTNLTGGSPIKFDYCYRFQGLGPNMDATIKVDMKRIYDYFQANSSGGYYWFSYSIRAVIETLHQQNAIHNEMNGGDAKQWEVLDKIAQSITERLFKPELEAKGQIGEADSNRPFRFNVGVVHKEELKEETWTWVRRDLEEREFCTAVALKDLEPYKKQLITDAD